MKIIIELNDREKMQLLEEVIRLTRSISNCAIKDYFGKISVDDFINVLRRALRTSCDAFFHDYMQCYIEQISPEIYEKIHCDLAKWQKKKRKSLQGHKNRELK